MRAARKGGLDGCKLRLYQRVLRYRLLLRYQRLYLRVIPASASRPRSCTGALCFVRQCLEVMLLLVGVQVLGTA
jgi:hypothetical protein